MEMMIYWRLITTYKASEFIPSPIVFDQMITNNFECTLIHSIAGNLKSLTLQKQNITYVSEKHKHKYSKHLQL